MSPLLIAGRSRTPFAWTVSMERTWGLNSPRDGKAALSSSAAVPSSTTSSPQLNNSTSISNSVLQGTMYQYVTETDGSTSTYQYDGVIFRFSNAGTWKGDSSVKQKLEFFAVRRR